MNNDIRINHNSEVPKYKQVVDLLLSDIEAGIFKVGQRIPSINETSEELLISRDTVEKAYVFLRKKGILASVRGKGYYVNKVDVTKKLKVALILNKLSNYKRSIYYSLSETLGNKASVDVFIYNYSIEQFEEILDEELEKGTPDPDEMLKMLHQALPEEMQGQIPEEVLEELEELEEE